MLFIIKSEWNDERVHLIQDTLKITIKKIVDIITQIQNILVDFKVILELMKSESYIFYKKKT
jgi:hypothetical protein